jgi:hypothetical protein
MVWSIPILFLFACAILITGCFEADIHQIVHRDGTLDIKVSISSDTEFLDAIKRDFVVHPERQDTYKFEESIFHQKLESVTYIFTDVSIDSFNLFIIDKESPVYTTIFDNERYKFSKKFSFPYYKYSYEIDMTKKNSVVMEDVTDDLSDARIMNFNVDVFGKIEDTNGEILDDGTVSFNIAPPEWGEDTKYFINFKEFFLTSWFAGEDYPSLDLLETAEEKTIVERKPQINDNVEPIYESDEGNSITLNGNFYVGVNQCRRHLQFLESDEESVTFNDQLTGETIVVQYNQSNSNEQGYKLELNYGGTSHLLRFDNKNKKLLIENSSETCPLTKFQAPYFYDKDYVPMNGVFKIGAYDCRHTFKLSQVDEERNTLNIHNNLSGARHLLAYDKSDVTKDGYGIKFNVDGLTYGLRYNEVSNLLYLEDVIQTCLPNVRKFDRGYTFKTNDDQCTHSYSFSVPADNLLHFTDKDTQKVFEVTYDISDVTEEGYLINFQRDGISYNLRYNGQFVYVQNTCE